MYHSLISAQAIRFISLVSLHFKESLIEAQLEEVIWADPQVCFVQNDNHQIKPELTCDEAEAYCLSTALASFLLSKPPNYWLKLYQSYQHFTRASKVLSFFFPRELSSQNLLTKHDSLLLKDHWDLDDLLVCARDICWWSQQLQETNHQAFRVFWSEFI